MTWADFKKEVEAKGVKDEMQIEYIDMDRYGKDSLQVVLPDHNNGVKIT